MDRQNQTNTTLPPIGQLFQESWHTFTQSILQLFLLNIVGIVIYLVLGILAVLVFIISGAGSSLLQQGIQRALTNLLTSPQTLTTAIIIGTIFTVIYGIVGSALQITSILIIDKEGKLSLGNSIKKSFGLIIPLFVTGILTFILAFGALVFFILPAILFFILLSFVQFEVVLNNQRWLKAVKRSVLLVSKHFGAILIRFIILMLLYLAYSTLLSLLRKIGPEVSVLVSIISFIINLLLGWFALAYSITLYKQAKVGLDREEGKGIVWMWVIAILGWIIAGLLFFAGYKTVSSGILDQVFKKSGTNNQLQTTSASSFMKSGSVKLSTASQMLNKTNLTESDKEQIKILLSGSIEDLIAATKAEPTDYQTWYQLGSAYKGLMSFTEDADKFAISSFTKAISLNPNDYNSYLQLGGIYYQLRQYNEALKNFKRVTELQPKYANGYFNLGMTYKQLGIKDSAKQALEKTLELLPKNDPTRYKAEDELNSL